MLTALRLKFSSCVSSHATFSHEANAGTQSTAPPGPSWCCPTSLSTWGSGPRADPRHADRARRHRHSVRGTVSKGEGVAGCRSRRRPSIRRGCPAAIRSRFDRTGPEPRPIDLPDELRAMFNEEPVAALFEDLPAINAPGLGEPHRRRRTGRRRGLRRLTASAGIRDRAFPAVTGDAAQ